MVTIIGLWSKKILSWTSIACRQVIARTFRMHSDEWDEPEIIRCSENSKYIHISISAKWRLYIWPCGDFDWHHNARCRDKHASDIERKFSNVETFYFTAQDIKINRQIMKCQLSFILCVPEPPVYCAGKAPVVVLVTFSEPVP